MKPTCKRKNQAGPSSRAGVWPRLHALGDMPTSDIPQAGLLPPPISSTSASRANELVATSSVELKRRACDRSAVQHRRRRLHHRPSLAGVSAAHCKEFYCRCQATQQ
jgi:hypothetical protein